MYSQGGILELSVTVVVIRRLGCQVSLEIWGNYNSADKTEIFIRKIPQMLFAWEDRTQDNHIFKSCPMNVILLRV